jgi:hypothetical protein
MGSLSKVRGLCAGLAISGLVGCASRERDLSSVNSLTEPILFSPTLGTYFAARVPEEIHLVAYQRETRTSPWKFAGMRETVSIPRNIGAEQDFKRWLNKGFPSIMSWLNQQGYSSPAPVSAFENSDAANTLLGEHASNHTPAERRAFLRLIEQDYCSSIAPHSASPLYTLTWILWEFQEPIVLGDELKRVYIGTREGVLRATEQR